MLKIKCVAFILKWGITCTAPCVHWGSHEYACEWSWKFHGALRGSQAVALHCRSNGEWWRFRRGSSETPRNRRGGPPRTSLRQRSQASGHCWAVWPGRPAPPRNAAHWAGTVDGRRTRLSGSQSHLACTWLWKIHQCCGCCRRQEAPLRSSRNSEGLHKTVSAISPASETFRGNETWNDKSQKEEN